MKKKNEPQIVESGVKSVTTKSGLTFMQTFQKVKEIVKNEKVSTNSKKSIYKKSALQEISEDEKKARRILRKTTKTLLSIIVENENSTKIKSFVSDFVEFYQSAFETTDFSVSSITQSEENKGLVEKALRIIEKNK